MMAVDTSALVRIALVEPGADVVLQALEKAERVELSAANLLETALVLRTRKSDFSVQSLKTWLQAQSIEIVALDLAQADVAVAAGMRFGKGSGHPAQLNYGDCFAYALAKVRRAPLLFVGDDFTHTDIPSALAAA